MLIKELKTEIEKYNEKEYQNIKKTNSKKKKEVPFEDLNQEITYFLQCVDNVLCSSKQDYF